MTPFPSALYNDQSPAHIIIAYPTHYIDYIQQSCIYIHSFSSPKFPSSFSELANVKDQTLEDSENERVVLALYEALSSRDVGTVHKLLASDLEWWFHGPPSHQFMMRLLTGTDTSDAFDFVPQTVVAFGPTVLVEGYDKERNITWVHAWTVSDGIITQVREYFNTALTVTRFSNTAQPTKPNYPEIASSHCPSVWESSLSNRVGKSVPGLVLAI